MGYFDNYAASVFTCMVDMTYGAYVASLDSVVLYIHVYESHLLFQNQME